MLPYGSTSKADDGEDKLDKTVNNIQDSEPADIEMDELTEEYDDEAEEYPPVETPESSQDAFAQPLARKSTYNNDNSVDERYRGRQLVKEELQSEWARNNSTVAPDFLKRYFSTSRLHWLSTWKANLKANIAAQRREQNIQPKQYLGANRLIMHVDFDCFFASVSIGDQKELLDKPVAVSHGKTASVHSSGEIASCNYPARAFGIHNGMFVGTAKELCKDLIILPYEFDKYEAVSNKFYDVLLSHCNELEPVSIDEALLDITHLVDVNSSDEIYTFARQLRKTILEVTGYNVSIGVGHNILQARFVVVCHFFY